MYGFTIQHASFWGMILRQVPNEPDKTELIAVTHVYSPMIPLMLAKNAGVKGAVDFVRDIRSLS